MSSQARRGFASCPTFVGLQQSRPPSLFLFTAYGPCEAGQTKMGIATAKGKVAALPLAGSVAEGWLALPKERQASLSLLPLAYYP